MKKETTMKRPDEHRENEIRRTIAVLDDLPKLQASPLFRVHLMQRIETSGNRPFWSAATGFPEGIKVKFAFAAILLAINITSATLFFTAGETLSLADAGETMEQLTEDYSGEELAYYVDATDTGSNRETGKAAGQEQNKP
jgi:hypothetical protein